MLALLLVTGLVAFSGDPIEEVARSFPAPPPSARPHTWWHWMDGNVTRAGITADLEAMAAVGIGGAHIFDVGQGVPAGEIEYNSPAWRELMVHAIREGERLGLDMTMHNCAGWSSSSGPWVRPEDAMKKLVFSVTWASGPGLHPDPVPLPPVAEGYYRDVAVLVVRAQRRPEQSHAAGLLGLGPNPGPVEKLDGPTVTRGDILCLPPTSIGPDHRLKEPVPAGQALVVRIGATLTGARNVASRSSGVGWEVDKLSASALDRFFAGGLDPLFDQLGPSSALHTVLIDSYETGYQNWTDGLLDEFRERRGYDATPYLAALAGFVVEDSETTLGFLFDYRQTLAELWAENYTDHFAKRLSERKMGLAIEPYGNGNFDPFAYARSASLIMGEYWVGETESNPSVKHASSIAHVMGISVVGAEALTAAPNEAGWRNHPRQWKPYADLAMTRGVNRIIYHRFAHQPWVEGVLPGMTMGPWGSHVDRTNTIWPYMPEWNMYLTRCQYVLQQGHTVADVLLFSGEDAPQGFAGEGQDLPTVPAGYDFDFCGLEPLTHMSVRDGRIVSPSGASYALVALPNSTQMTVRLARKIRDLVREGAVVVGPKPTRTPSLGESLRGGDTELRAIADEVWGQDGGSKSEHRFGKGRVLSGVTIAEAFGKIGVGPDMVTPDSGLAFTHRRIGTSDAYFVASRMPYPRVVTCRFRTGEGPVSVELWRPETGRIEVAPVWRRLSDESQGSSIEVSLRMEADESVFVVLRPARRDSPHIEEFSSVPSVAAGQEPPKLRIIKAEYGDFATKQVRDVTQVIAQAANPYGVRIPASNGALGGDPAVNIVKQLTVTYELGGKVITVTLRENDVLELGEFPSATSAPDAELAADGLAVYRNGTYTLRTGSRVRTIEVTDAMDPLTLTGEWILRFPPGWDAPEFSTIPKLISWTDSDVFGIRYFSGTARYEKSFVVPREAFPYEEIPGSTRWVLDLGEVRELCQVRLNGRLLGKMWKPPFRVDVTGILRGGLNHLEVEVVNLWVNRLIGDEQFPDDVGWNGNRLSVWPEWLRNGTPRPEPRRKTFTTWRHNTKDTPLLPSGLLGPVQIRRLAVHSLW